MTRRTLTIFASLALFTGLALRLHHLGVQSLWYDETVTTYLAQQSIPDLLAHTARDIHPPAYYLLMHAWLHLVPTQPGFEFLAAWPSLVWGMLLLPLTYAVGRRAGLGRSVSLGAMWLAAIAPFHIWYSQEVRMYTLGAALGMTCIWSVLALLPSPADAKAPRWPAWAPWLAYVLAAAAGLYTLYYFGFLLLALNVLVLLRLLLPARPGPAIAARRPFIGRWLVAQFVVLLLFLPWLPTAIRQITNPPVPPWRTATGAGTMLVESLTALGFGQSLPTAAAGLAVFVITALLLLALLRPWSRRAAGQVPPWAPWFLLGCTLLPLLGIASITLWVTPLYHVRYVFTYAPTFSLLLALGLHELWQLRAPVGRALGVGLVVILVLLSGWSMQQLWTNPALAADDHRGAVQFLAKRWRPGDVILVNAGYPYTALLTYWNLPVSWLGRLSDFTPAVAAQLADAPGAVIVQAGSVDGDPALGWGLPESDFYALSAATARQRLDEMRASQRRLWQYRIYDTVTDPRGVIRDSLHVWPLFEDQVFSGEANLRVQGFWGDTASEGWGAAAQRVTVGEGLTLETPLSATQSVVAGDVLNIPLLWRRLPGSPGPVLATSLRLVDDQGTVWAQYDEAVGGSQRDLRQASAVYQPLQLAVPAGTAPGAYRLVLVPYDPASGQPLLVAAAGADGSEAWEMAQVEVLRPEAVARQPALAMFGDQIALVAAHSPATLISAGDTIALELTWQAQPGYRAEDMIVVMQLLDAHGQVVANAEAPPLDGRYGTGVWQAGELVRDRHTLTTPATLAPGAYRLVVGLDRAASGERLTVPCGLGGLARCLTFDIQPVIVR